MRVWAMVPRLKHMTEKIYHKPVLLAECMEGLDVKADGVYVDVTYGGGGHSRAIAQLLGEDGRLYAFDQDADALANAPTDSRVKVIHGNFSHVKAYLRLEGVRKVDGILADLGISSHQIDAPWRGFSTRLEGQLDMRMDVRQETTAADIVNTYEEDDLRNILKLYGELPNAGQMARSIVEARKEGEIKTTGELCESVRRHLPRGYENKYLAMLFQAIRIEVNGEQEALKALLEQSSELLKEGGRLVVISYHSLEDRLVKNYIKTGNFKGEVKKDFYGNPIAPYRAVNRKVITPTEAELQDNSRSRSAKLRVGERV